MRVVFVGTSDAFGAGGRRQAAIFVESSSGGVLLDCAPTTGSGLAALGIERLAVDVIALSHFHADHFAGVPQLVLASAYEDRRRRPLLVAGPPGVEARVHAAADAIGYGLRGRELPFPLRFVELPADALVDVGPVRLASFPVHHQAEVCPHGLRLEAAGRTIAYSGDTGWFEALPARLRGADLAICECTFLRPVFPYHLDYPTLAEHAPGFGCGRLVLTHLGPAMAERRGQLALETADDGLTLRV
ncbi:MAG: MBL fold metallo-hydrolase [Deltaproteobacteria bacterium]|nr:MBL fold metallo-hydrolase [Deltaproteobacteria bacterium]